MINTDDIPVKREGIIIRELGDEIIIITEDSNEMHSLDAIGSYIWNNIDGKKSVKALSDLICEEYEVEGLIAVSDLIIFIETLLNMSLITIKN